MKIILGNTTLKDNNLGPSPYETISGDTDTSRETRIKSSKYVIDASISKNIAAVDNITSCTTPIKNSSDSSYVLDANPKSITENDGGISPKIPINQFKNKRKMTIDDATPSTSNLIDDTTDTSVYESPNYQNLGLPQRSQEQINNQLILSNVYDMSYENNYMLIFNHIKILGKEERFGTNKDVLMLNTTFNKYNFIIDTKDDLDLETLKKTMKTCEL